MPLVTFHVLHFPPAARFAAFTRFVRMRTTLPGAPGVRFAKVMGCGRGAVFSIRPDWSRYAYLAEWADAEAAAAFLISPAWQENELPANLGHHFLLQPLHSKGLWDGEPRFSPPGITQPDTNRLAVITRADLKPWKLRSFFAHAREATAALSSRDGLRYSLGMGEWPFVRQATFSVWDSVEVMKAYAYKNAAHLKAMRGKNSQRWYGEEMYARFAVVAESNKNSLELFTDG